MGNYLLAEMIVSFENRFDYIPRLCHKFACDASLSPDITVSVTDAQLQKERATATDAVSDGYLEGICAYRELCLQMLRFDRLFFHSAVIDVGGRGIAFTANSGVGKTTHLRLWKELLGEKMTVVNGDKPILRLDGDTPIAYGTPWCGKENYHSNASVPLTDICFLERSKENFIEPLPAGEAVNRILHQLLYPTDPMQAVKTLELTDKLLKGCRIWQLGCNMELEAAQVAYRTLFKGESL